VSVVYLLTAVTDYLMSAFKLHSQFLSLACENKFFERKCQMRR